MSDESPRLSAEAVALLLEVLDLEEPCMNGAVAEMSPGPVGMLRASGLLVRWSLERAWFMEIPWLFD